MTLCPPLRRDGLKHKYVYTTLSLSLSLYIYIYIYICMYVCIYIYMYIYIYVFVCVCVCVGGGVHLCFDPIAPPLAGCDTRSIFQTECSWFDFKVFLFLYWLLIYICKPYFLWHVVFLYLSNNSPLLLFGFLLSNFLENIDYLNRFALNSYGSPLSKMYHQLNYTTIPNLQYLTESYENLLRKRNFM